MTTPASPTRWDAPSWLVAAVIAFGGLLRWAALQNQEAISVDSVRYLTFATGWIAQRFYSLGPTGLHEFPDLGYPLLVSLILPAVSDPIRAGQLVSWFAGIGVMVLVFRIARECYGGLVGFYAVLLAAVCLPLITACGQVLTESTYLFFSLLALDFSLLCLRRPTLGNGLGLGFACALGYLTRGIGIVLLPCALGLLWWYGRRGESGEVVEAASLDDVVAHEATLRSYQGSLLGTNWTACLAGALLLWGVIVAPYWVMLDATYHGFTLSDQAIWHVGGLSGSLKAHSPDIRLEGTLNSDGTDYALNDWMAAGRPAGDPPSLKALAKRYAQNWVAILYYIPEELLDPLTLLLLTLGLFGNSVRPRLPRAARALLWWMAPYLLLQPLFLTLARYLLPAVPLLLIWAGRGVVSVQEWAIGRHLLHAPKASLADLAAVERVVFIALFILYMPVMIWPITHVDPRFQNLETKAAGDWLRTHNARGGIFATTPVAGYYAGLEPNLVLPDAPLSQILPLAARKEIRYLVLDERRVPATHPAELTALLYLPPEALPTSVHWLADIAEWPGYRVRILELSRSSIAQGKVAE